MSLTISHNHENGTILEGSAKGDGSNLALKQAGGWRWSRNLGAWYVPQSRDRDAKHHIIDRAAAALREAGFEVEVEVDNEARPYAEVEADRQARLEARGDRLEDRAARKARDAETAESRRVAALARVPEGGEPIKIGHHSETRHRNAIDKSWNALGKKVEADRAADAAVEAVAASRANADYRESPRAVALRIDRLAAEVRRWQRSVDSYAEKGEVSERHTEGLRRKTEELDYWKGVHAQQVADGIAGKYDKETVRPGDWVKVGGAGWSEVVRSNQKSVTVDVSAIFRCDHTLRYEWAKVTGHKTAEQIAEARARLAEDSGAPVNA